MKIRYIAVVSAMLCLLCLVCPVIATDYQHIEDGDFSDYSAGSGFTYWEIGQTPPASQQTDTNYARVVGEGGGAHYQLSVKQDDLSVSRVSSVYLKQYVDLTGVDYLTFKTKKGSISDLALATIVLNIIQNGQYIGSYSFSDLGSTSSWTSQSISVSSLSGTVELRLYSEVESQASLSQKSVDFYITDVSAIASSPTLSSSTVSSAIVKSNSEVSLTYAFAGTAASTATTYICWGDSEIFYSYNGLSGTATHTYSSPGTYPITAYARNSVGTSPTTTLSTIDVVTLDFSAYGASSGNAPFTAEFTYSASSNIVGLSWNFGDGSAASSSTVNPTQHTYTGTGVYDVSLTGTTSLGRTLTVTKDDLINTMSQGISFGAASYAVGDTAVVSWTIRNPDFTNHNYYVYIYQAVSDGTRADQNAIYQYQIPNTATTSMNWATSGLSGGYYTAYLYEDNTVLAYTSPAVSVISYVTLTVNLATAGMTYTNSTTVNLIQNGATVQTKTTTTGQAVFNSVPTGTYQVQGITAGYATQSASVVLTASSSITIDFVTGTSEDTGVGMGNQYAATYVTFRCLDSGTGKYLSGVTVNVVGVEPTNPIEWMANLFGSAWGSKMIGTNLTAVSDSNGVVTFAMVPNVRYQISIRYGDYTDQKVFQPSTLTGEYPLELEITKWNTDNLFDLVKTSITPTESKTIIANYTDNTGTTQSLNISLYVIEDSQRVLIDSQQAVANTYSITFTPESPSGKSYVVTFTAVTTKVGEITREYSVDFNGPRIALGSLPDNFYIVISFLILAMLGGVGTMVTSKMYCLVVVVAAGFLWYAGWLFALGSVGSVVLLLCFVLAIIYYISTKSGGGE